MKKKFFFWLIFFFINILLLEGLSYIFFPKFRENHIFYQKEVPYVKVSKGIEIYFSKFNNLLVRVQSYKKKISFENKNTIWLLGDSITDGYGVKFEETYYYKLKNKLNNKYKHYNVVPISSYGNSINDISSIFFQLKKHIKSGDLVIYQFNYNDLTPYAKLDLASEANLKITEQEFVNKIIFNSGKFRYKYLNHSVFLKVFQYHTSRFLKKTNGSCLSRKMDALGPYTWAYFSKGFEKESEIIWKRFERDLRKIKNEISTIKSSFIVLISPISLQLKNHNQNNKLNFDINCSSQEPYKKLKMFLDNEKIKFVDPLRSFLISERKGEILFHHFDTNHPNKNGHNLIGKELFLYINSL